MARLSFSFPDELKDVLMEKAAEEERSLSSYIRNVLVKTCRTNKKRRKRRIPNGNNFERQDGVVISRGL